MRAHPFSMQTWERIAAGLSDHERSDTRSRVTFRVGAFVLLGAVVWRARHLRIRPASRKSGQHVLHTPANSPLAITVVEQNVSLTEAVPVST